MSNDRKACLYMEHAVRQTAGSGERSKTSAIDKIEGKYSLKTCQKGKF